MMPSSPSPAAIPSAVRWTRALAIGSLLGLIVLSLLWELRIAPLRPGGSWLALKALPLALPMAGMLKHRLYTYRWTSLMVWIYMIEGLVRATSEHGAGAACAWIEVVLCALLFAACCGQVRWRLRHRVDGVDADGVSGAGRESAA